MANDKSTDLPSLDYDRGERWMSYGDRNSAPVWAPYMKQREDETLEQFIYRVKLKHAEAAAKGIALS